MRRSHKLLLLGSLYIAQGLPYGFFTQALPVLMREAGLSLKLISATSLLFAPWMLKFLWAPLVDHRGTRRQWIVPLQLASAAGAFALATTDLRNDFRLIFAAMLLFNTFAAIQDVATDGLAVRVLSMRERGLGNGIQVGAYRIGMIAGGGLLLYLFAKAGWPLMFAAMGGLLLLCSLPVLLLREADAPALAVVERPHWRALLRGWWPRLRLPGMLGFIGLVWAYKFGDTLVASLVGPLLTDHGLRKEQIALIKGTVGSIMGLSGAALGGWCAYALGRRATLLGCGLLQTASLLLYVGVAYGIGDLGMIWAASVCEHLFGGMATVALFTLMMDASDPDHAGTDYTLLACAAVLAQGLAAFSGGALADAWGYGVAFIAGCALSGIGCVLLTLALDRGAGPARLRAVWPLRAAAH